MSAEVVKLQPPRFESRMSIESALLARRSIRSYKAEPLSPADVSQLLWAAQGLTHPGGYRTAPSAGALYPLEVYILAGNVSDLAPGVYKYVPAGHELFRTVDRDVRNELCLAALSQSPVANAPVVMVICGVNERTTRKYRERGLRYVYMEAGHASQNVSLQVVSLNLGTVVIGAFDDEEVRRILKLKSDERPLYIMPIGK